MSSSMQIDNKNKDILVLGERPAEGVDGTTLTAETIYPISFVKPNTKFVLRLHDKATIALLLMLQNDTNSKQKTLK